MIDRIGNRRPTRLFIREWMRKLDINNKKLAERMDRAEGTLSKLLSAADYDPHKRSKQKVTIGYLEEIAHALDIEVEQLFRDPDMPTRDELLRGYTNEELTSALQLIEHTRRVAGERNQRPEPSQSGKTGVKFGSSR